MSKYTIESSTLTGIADAIRSKAGTTEALKPSDMPEAIAAIQAGGGSGSGSGCLGNALYYNAAGGSYYGSSNYQPIDVSNASTLNFKYTFNVGTGSICPVTLTAYLGYATDLKSNGFYGTLKVDDNAQTQAILSNNGYGKTDIEVSIDVSAYTTVVFYTYFKSGGTNSKSSLCIHDIELV